MGASIAHLHVTPKEFWDDYSFCPFFTALNSLNPNKESDVQFEEGDSEKFKLMQAKFERKKHLEQNKYNKRPQQI